LKRTDVAAGVGVGGAHRWYDPEALDHSRSF